LFPAYLYLKGDGALPGNLRSTHLSVPLPRNNENKSSASNILPVKNKCVLFSAEMG